MGQTGMRFWVQANFKEDQLAHMRVGQSLPLRLCVRGVGSDLPPHSVSCLYFLRRYKAGIRAQNFRPGERRDMRETLVRIGYSHEPVVLCFSEQG